MSATNERVYQGRKAKLMLGEKLVIGHLKQTFKRYFRADCSFDYPDLGRQGKIMYSNCSLDFQRLHMEAISNKDYVASMIKSQQQSLKFSPWGSGAGFYISRYSDFVALWSWFADPEDSAYKNLECQGWQGELAEPVAEYAHSIGKLEERLKHSGEVLSKIENKNHLNQKAGKLVKFRKGSTT